jgi:hypothetical protein
MTGRFNRFQRAMLAWDELHPYNAVHVVRVAAAHDAPRLRHAVEGTLQAWGLTNLALHHDGRRFEYRGGPVSIAIRELAGGRAALPAEIERQLNTPFERRESFQPFRFFVAPEGNAFLLGLVYFHPVADAESIVCLLRAIVDAFHGRPASAAPPELYPAGLHLGPMRAAGWFARQLLALPGLVRLTRTACRPVYRDAQDLTNGFTAFTLEPPALDALRVAGRAWEVTFNDLLLALLLRAIAPLARPRQRGRRRGIAAGCVVNLRKEPGAADRHGFGLFLGSFLVAHEAPAGLGLRELATDIASQTARVKAERRYLGTPLQLAVAGWALRFFSTRRKRTFYQKHWPLWGGITNMNLNALWDSATPGGPADYWRAVSTGPVTPLVLSATSVADRINIGLSHRTAVYSTADIRQLRDHLAGSVAELQTDRP